MAIIQSGENNLQQQVFPEVSTTQSEASIVSSPSVDETQPVNESYGGMATPTIVNQNVPVVVFVGPPSSGKSMILVRLAKFLRTQGYTVKTDPTFLNTAKYQEDCEKFQTSLATTTALPGSVTFLLVNIYDKCGVVVAKLLEAPGEDFYTTDSAKIRSGKNNMIEPYLQTIMTSRNIKSYVMLLDLDSDLSFRRDGNHRQSYEQRILNDFYRNIDKNRDRVVLLYNKIDRTPFGDIHGCNNLSGALQDAKNFYPTLFASMKVTKFGFLTMDNFSFKTFCTGMFARQTNNLGEEYQTYNIASDAYPRDLWKEIISKW